MGIPPAQIAKLQALARSLTGLGTAVTPYSEWIKQIGFAIWKNEEIQPKTLEAATAYIQQGGQLAIAEPILQGLREWKTLLPRPEIVNQLLINHGLKLIGEARREPQKKALDLEGERVKLQAKLPHTRVNDRVLSTALAFDKIGLAFLEQRDHGKEAEQPRDLTPLMSSPGFVYSQTKQVGDSFSLYDRALTISKIAPAQNGQVEVDYRFQGHTIRTKGVDPHKLCGNTATQKRFVKDKNKECGAPMAGTLSRFFVKPGDHVKKGDKLFQMDAMKMEHLVKADRDFIVESIESDKQKEGGEVVLTFKEMGSTAPKP
ncbi:MAG TPA: biotin/lipoyl-containing protein, partial [Gammaproteobacteria bacterium]|nr:biotin/lipoyl-containing protein [Gammaproteobacteria bacterium]